MTPAAAAAVRPDVTGHRLVPESERCFIGLHSDWLPVLLEFAAWTAVIT